MLVAESTCFSVLGMLKMLYATTRSWRHTSGKAVEDEKGACEPWQSSAKEVDGVGDIEGGDEMAVRNTGTIGQQGQGLEARQGCCLNTLAT